MSTQPVVGTINERVVKVCEKHWDAHSDDCSGFVKAVAADLGVALSGQANDITDKIQQQPWVKLSDGKDAAQKASTGLVIGGVKATGNGHVVVVVSGPLGHGKYPTGYWGKLNSVGKKNTTINWAFGPDDRDNVVYGWYRL